MKLKWWNTIENMCWSVDAIIYLQDERWHLIFHLICVQSSCTYRFAIYHSSCLTSYSDYMMAAVMTHEHIDVSDMAWYVPFWPWTLARSAKFFHGKYIRQFFVWRLCVIWYHACLVIKQNTFNVKTTPISG